MATTASFIGVYAQSYGPYGTGGGTVKPTLSVPANLRVVGTPTTDTIVWAWDAAANADGYVLRDGAATIYSGPALTFAQGNLVAGSTHSATVGATDSTSAYRSSQYSPTVAATTKSTTPAPSPLPRKMSYRESGISTTSGFVWHNAGSTGALHDLQPVSGAPTVEATSGKYGGQALRASGSRLRTVQNQPYTGVTPRVFMARIYLTSYPSANTNLFGAGNLNGAGTLADCYLQPTGEIVFHASPTSPSTSTKVPLNQWVVIGYRVEPSPSAGATNGALVSSFVGANDAGAVKIDCTNQGGGSNVFSTADDLLYLLGGSYGGLNTNFSYLLDAWDALDGLTDVELTRAINELLTDGDPNGSTTPPTPAPAYTIVTPSPVTNYTINNTDYDYFAYEKTNSDGYKLLNSYCDAGYIGKAGDTIRLEQASNLSDYPEFQGIAGMSVDTGSGYVLYPVAPNSGTAKSLTPGITLPGTPGDETVFSILNGYVGGQQHYNGGDFVGTAAYRIISTQGVQLIRRVRPADVEVHFHDSIKAGNRASNTATKSSAMLYRTHPSQAGKQVIFAGYGSMVGAYSFNADPSLGDATRAQAVAVLQNVTGARTVVMQASINSRLAGIDYKVNAGAYGNFIDYVRGQFPNTTFRVLTEYYQERTSFQAADYSNSLAGLSTGKDLATPVARPYVQVFDAGAVDTHNDLVQAGGDLLHHVDSGMAKDAAFEVGCATGTIAPMALIP